MHESQRRLVTRCSRRLGARGAPQELKGWLHKQVTRGYRDVTLRLQLEDGTCLISGI